jgi:tetratricopeptide (TPR) repeat protein
MPKLPQYPFAEKIKQWKKDFLKLWGELHKFGDIFKANFELGKKHYGLGNFQDAVLRFKFVVWLEPKYSAGWYWLGLSHLALAQKPASIKALKKAVSLKPDWQEATEALNSALNSESKNA